MTDPSEEELKIVEELAELHFSIKETSIFLGKDLMGLKLLFEKKTMNFIIQ